ncbi:AraC family transcriptional regulator, partial [Pseudomonas aeruginosa]
ADVYKRQELERQEQRFPNLEEVAARLHLSSRSLKRHLHDAGTSFRQLLGQARQRQALRLLRRPEVSLQRIALYLGYSDPTNFTRAFKRW